MWSSVVLADTDGVMTALQGDFVRKVSDDTRRPTPKRAKSIEGGMAGLLRV
jgi:hypothetical protein